VAPSGVIRTVEFTGILNLIYNSANLVLPGGVNLTTAPNDIGIFRSRGNGAWISVSWQPASGAPPLELTADDVGLGNVENIKLSTWPGSSNLTTVGTISTGVWQGTPISPTKGGTGLTALNQGDIIYAGETNVYYRLPKSTVAKRYLSNQGGVNNSPDWQAIDLTTGVTGILPEANGGGMQIPIGGIVDFSGTTPPTGWLLCFGQSVARGTYAALFAVIGTTYGSVDAATFSLPDCRGRIVAGKDNMGGVTAGRLTATYGPNGTILGAVGGLESHVLTEAQLANHTHQYNALGGAGGFTLSAGGQAYALQNATFVGGNVAHNNVQPTIVFNKIIRY
jgi:microcystin-dependent protein